MPKYLKFYVHYTGNKMASVLGTAGLVFGPRYTSKIAFWVYKFAASNNKLLKKKYSLDEKIDYFLSFIIKSTMRNA